eukprot:g2159.t1
MYSSIGRSEGTMEQLSGQTMWSPDYERDYGNYIDPSMLQELDELPRATSAPPHLINRYGTASTDILNRSGRLQGVDTFTDIRYDEDYPAFYKLHGEADNLPPPIDASTIYSEMQGYLPPGTYPRFNSAGVSPYGLSAGQGSGQLSSQASLGRIPLETVEEQPTPAKDTNPNNSVFEALSQFHIGNEIQRPGSQPAPNLLQALAAEAGHYRSASSLASFNLDGFSGIHQQATTGTGGVQTSSTSSPITTSQPSGINAMLQSPAPQTNDYLTQVHGQNSMLAGSLEYQAAYQAALQTALMQSQNNQQMMMGSPQIPSSSSSAAAASSSPIGRHHGSIQPHGMTNDASIIAAKMQQGPVHGYFNQGGQTTSSVGTKEPVHYSKEDHGGRGKRHGRRDRDRGGDPMYSSGPSGSDPYYDSPYLKFNAIDEVVGQVIHVAQDQNGCRFLQRKFEEGGSQAISKVFGEILENIVPLMKDPFGNYLIQKLLDRCSEAQRTDVVKTVAGGELITIALSTHGTRAVQKLIETLSNEEQRQLAISALKSGVVKLIKDLNGNHVVQRCLQRLGPEDSQFIYDAAIDCCVEIASHRHGCCVLQRCIDFATPEQKHDLIMEISANALVLSQDAFGNYVVQYVLDLGQPEASQSIMNVLSGHYSDLAVQKFSSNVVEKCLKLGGLEDARESIIKEIMHSPALARLLQDPFGNYVVQSALSVTSGSLHQSLVECIRPYLPALKGTPHGKRILQKVLASLKDPY